VSVIFTRPWTTQPQVVVSPNWGNPLTLGATLLVHPVRGFGMLDAVSNAPWVNAGALLKASPSGMAVDTDGSTTCTTTFDPLGASIAAADLWTIACEFTPRNAATDAFPIGFGSAVDPAPILGIRVNSTSAGQVSLFYRNTLSTITVSVGVGSFTVGQRQRVVISNRGAASRSLFVNGLSVIDATTQGACDPTQFAIGCLNRTTAALFFDGSVSQVFIAKGVAWTDSQAMAWINNPNQLYAPLPRRIWAPQVGATIIQQPSPTNVVLGASASFSVVASPP
jgi:hypothetical protein